MRLVDKTNHILGTYIATGVNNPKKYPRKPLMRQPTTSRNTQTARQMAAMLGAKINE